MEQRIINQLYRSISMQLRIERNFQCLQKDLIRSFQSCLNLYGVAIISLNQEQSITYEEEPAGFVDDGILDYYMENINKSPNTHQSKSSQGILYYFHTNENRLFLLGSKTPLNEKLLQDIETFTRFIASFFEAIESKNKIEKLENSLREEQHLLRMIIDSIPEYVVYKNNDNVYLVTNKIVDELYKSQFDTVQGKHVRDIYPYNEQLKIYESDERVRKIKAPIREDTEVYTSAGKKWMDTIRTPVMDSSNNIQGILTVSRDLSEQKKLMSELEQSLYFQEILIQIATSFINVGPNQLDTAINEALSLSGNYIEADRAYVFRYYFDEGYMDNTHEWCNEGVSSEMEYLRGLAISDYEEEWVKIHQQGGTIRIPHVEELDHESMVYKTLSAQNIQSVMTFPLMQGSRCLGFVGFDDVKNNRMWNDFEGNLLVLLAQIITNMFLRQETENNLIQSKIEAEEASQSKSTFLANMSHEIRTPLSGLFNAIYLLNNSNLSLMQKEYVSIANISLEALNSIVTSILDLSKIESGRLERFDEWFDLEDEIHKILQMQQPIADEKGLELKLDFDYHIPTNIYYDGNKLKQVVLNLVNNALKFTEIGGVYVNATLISTTKESYTIEICVEDTGVGIDEEAKEKLFDMFFQADHSITKKYKGAGLGLTIAHQLIHFLKGKITVESKRNVGSRFIVEITIPKKKIPSNIDYRIDKQVLMLLAETNIRTKNIKKLFTSIATKVDEIVVKEHFDRLERKKKYDLIVCMCSKEMNEHNHQKILQYFGKSDSVLIWMIDQISVQSEPVDGVIPLLKDDTRKNVVDKIVSWDGNVNQSNTSTTFDLRLYQDLQGLNILIVDDNIINLKALESILKKFNMVTELAVSGEDALQKIAENDYHLILMDIQMPNMSGYEATKIIRLMNNNKRNVPIIAVTAHAFQSDYANYIDAGMNDVVTKPIRMEELLQKIAKNVSVDIDQTQIRQVIVPPKLEIMNIQDFHEQFINDSLLEKQIIETFLQEYSNDLIEIKRVIDEAQRDNIYAKIHYFKGSCAYLSAKRVLWVCEKMLDTIKDNNIDSINESFYLLEQETLSFVNVLKELLKEYL